MWFCVNGLTSLRAKQKHANRSAFAKERRSQHCAKAAFFLGLEIGVVGIRQHVANLHRLSFEHCSANGASAVDRMRDAFYKLKVVVRKSVTRRIVKRGVFLARNRRHIGIAQFRC